MIYFALFIPETLSSWGGILGLMEAVTKKQKMSLHAIMVSLAEGKI